MSRFRAWALGSRRTPVARLPRGDNGAVRRASMSHERTQTPRIIHARPRPIHPIARAPPPPHQRARDRARPRVAGNERPTPPRRRARALQRARRRPRARRESREHRRVVTAHLDRSRLRKAERAAPARAASRRLGLAGLRNLSRTSTTHRGVGTAMCFEILENAV